MVMLFLVINCITILSLNSETIQPVQIVYTHLRCHKMPYLISENVGSKVVHHSNETFEELVLPLLDYGRKVFASLKASSVVGTFSQPFHSTFRFPFPLEMTKHDCNIVDRAINFSVKTKDLDKT